MIDIKYFTYWEGPGGWAWGIIRSEKWESHMNSTHTKIKFPIIVIVFFLWLIFKIFLIEGRGREGIFESDVFCFFYYYFINAIMSTFHISSFIVVYIDIWHIVTACYVLMCFSPLLKSTFLATKNASPPTVFDLGGWNGHHFVGNWVAGTATGPFF